MTRHGPALLALSVLAIASWTYNVNYDTRAALERISDLRGNIADERERLQVLHVEWAWLNKPDRLARLVSENNDTLALTPLTPDAFGRVASVPYPPDLPADPAPERAPEPAPEMLLALAEMPDEAGSGRMAQDVATGPGLGAPEGAEADEGAPLAAEGEDDARVPLEESVGPPKLASVTEGPAVDTAPADPSTGESAPDTMREAVALALVEAGVAQPAELAAAAPVPVIAASAGGIPVPPARPAVWSGR